MNNFCTLRLSDTIWSYHFETRKWNRIVIDVGYCFVLINNYLLILISFTFKLC